VRADTPFDPAQAAKKLLREARSGALATIAEGSGDPYCSLVNVATAADGSPILLISRLALHTRNILAYPRVSLMLDERKAGDPLEGARVSLMGSAALEPDPRVRARYLARHPAAAGYAGFADFAVYRIAVQQAHLVAGFGRIVDLGAGAILIDTARAQALLDAEEGACAHMNADHADALRLYATKLLGAPDGEWRCAGCDPEGLELQHGSTALRLAFPSRVDTPAELRAVLRQLAEQARAVA
jgi:putative heme iron utilization protein